MATTGRNRGDTATGNIEQNQGAGQQIREEGPSFEAPQQGQQVGNQPADTPNVPTEAGGYYDNSANAEAEAAAAARARAEAKARAEAEASAQRQANDRRIAKESQEAQANRVAPQTSRISTTSPVSPVEIKSTDNESVVIDELTGNILSGAETNFGRELASYSEGERKNAATQARISLTLNDNALVDEHGELTEAGYRARDQWAASLANKSKGRRRKKNIPNEAEARAAGSGSYASSVVDSVVGASTQPGNKSYNQQQASQQNQAQPQAQSQQREEQLPMRDRIDEFARQLFYSRNRQARSKNKSLYRRLSSGDIDYDEYQAGFDQEAFPDTLQPIIREKYRTNKEYETARAARKAGEDGDLKAILAGRQRGTGTQVKDTYKLDRLLDQTVWDMRVGFFHVESERLVEDKKTGEKHIEWSRRVENAMNTLMEDFDGTGLDGQRTVFRMVRLYATMAIDRQGKMFNQSQDEWSLTQDEFIDICDCMHRSILIFGHPFVAPVFLSESVGSRTTLRGTDMFPSGVIPRVVAEAITGEDSAIRFPQGHPKAGQPMTADDLIDVCHEEWLNRTQPLMDANLVNRTTYSKKKNKDGEEAKERNLVAQRIAIENALQAFARLDGMDAQAFGSRFNIDTAQHYKLAEYRDQLTEYATVTNGKYDSAAVKERMEQKAKAAEAKNKARRNRKKVSAFEASCNLMTSGIKTNALWWNIPVRVSAIAEKGVGNAQTWLTLAALRQSFAHPERYQISQEITDAFRTEEGYQAIDAAYLLLEIGGPDALRGFAQSGAPMTQTEAIKYLKDNVLREAGSERAAQIQELNIKLNKFSQKILAGDTAFKKSDITNFFNALMISNQAIADAQDRYAYSGQVDTYAGMSLTGAEMYDIFQANNGDVARFLTEVMTTSAGKDALMMMKANNIAQFNVLSYGVNSFLRDHGIGNAAITAFVDSFATYGVNFLYAMIPGSRTFTYLSLKQAERKGDITAADFAIGGGLGENRGYHGAFKFNADAGFYNGLKMNIMFDAITMGKWVCGGILLGGVLAALGFEPPDDERNVLNISMWKIGGNVGFGPDTDGDGTGDGIEIKNAYWLNDLTQWGLPNAYSIAIALSMKEGDTINGLSRREIMNGIFIDSILDQFDGNVVLDFTDCILNWGDDLIDIDKTIKDPTHEMETPSPFFGLSELGLRAFGKIVPGAPLYRAWGTSAALRGPNARMFTTNKVFDKSDDWAISVGKTDYIEDPAERLIRKYSAGNWLLAAMMDLGNLASGEGDKKTGYAWWEMPIRSKTEPYLLAMVEEQKMDYDHLEEGETKESYNAKRTDDLEKMIAERGYESPEEAIRDGFIITHDIRMAALDTKFSELNALKNEYDTKCELQFETYEEWYEYKSNYDKQKSEIWDFINDWLKNDDIPEWTEGYEQILSDWEVTYVKSDGSPATPLDLALDRLFNQGQGVEKKWSLKGNAPTSMLPFTWVQYDSNDIISRGWSGETNPAWENTDSNLTSYANLKALGDKVIPVGRDAGSTVNDVYYGEEYDGERLHPDDATIGERAWVAKKTKLSEDVKGFNAETATGGIYGDLGKSSGKGDDTDSKNSGNDADGNNSTDDDKKPWKGYGDKKPWKTSYSYRGGGGRSFYPRSSYGRGGRSSSGDYNPRIYNTSHNVNNDRAATMYTKQPQSARTTYLRPGFSTKGSREAYRRQDF